ncbi:YigZ family protein [Mycoplasma sp. CSL10137]|nr:YigZ family protein [Mycoplasma sp. CSL10137]MBN4084155.1 YigZ family protein [Mycoplasma sp. CSL10166]
MFDPITYEVKKSSFISYIFRFESKTELKNILNQLKKEHKKSRHICYSYIINNDGVESGGFSDDGEPKNTAGRPMFELMRIKNISNVLVVVIRYFGGIKLGAGGLIKAYRISSSQAIDKYLKETKND